MLAGLTIYRKLNNMSTYANPYSKSRRWLFVIPGGAATRQHLRDMAYIQELEFICWNVVPGRSDLGGAASVEGYLETKKKLTASSIINKLGGNAHLELVGDRRVNTREATISYISTLGSQFEEYTPNVPTDIAHV